jgi:cation diffusion facilitator CzcD-associated flavoprotein CzcO
MSNRIKIAIVGAGWMGIGCLRVLKDSGYQVDVYEKNNDLGGVWHPDNNYANLKCHNPANAVEFYDYALPDNIDRTQRLTSSQLFSYLKNYAVDKELTPHFHFSHQVTSLDYQSAEKSILLEALDPQKKLIQKTYDYVIYTNVFTNKHLPSFLQSDLFSGDIIHSMNATSERLNQAMSEDKKITVIGGSKTATDLILYFSNHGYQVNWLYREPYWFFKYVNKTVNTQSKLAKKIQKSLLGFINHLFMTYHKEETILYLLFRVLGLLHTYGKKQSFDLKRFHLASIRKDEMAELSRYNKRHGIQGDVAYLEKEGIRLSDNRFLPSDLIICCTGSGPNGKEILFKKDGQDLDLNDITGVYLSRIIPSVPRLIFTGFNSFTSGIVKTLIEGKWINKYIQSDFSIDYLEANQVEHSYPFFTKAPVFNSEKPLLTSYYSGIQQFIKCGDLDEDRFKSWLITCHMNTKAAHEPFDL